MSDRSSPAASATLVENTIPLFFVLIWSTGWIVAGFAARLGDPLWFLTFRYGLACLALVPVALVLRARWPNAKMAAHAMAAGVLLHAVYLGGVWWAVGHGVPSGVSGIIAGLQPVLTALFAPVLIGETISKRQWAGIAAGFAGVALVLYPKLSAQGAAPLLVLPLVVNLVAMVSITLGSFYQKRFLTGLDMPTSTFWQYVGAFAVTLPVSLLIENQRMAMTMTTVYVLAWSVLALSILSIFLFLFLIKRGAVSRAAAYIYLVPPVSALMAFLFFGETLVPVQLFGMAVTAFGVFLAARS